VVEYESHYAVDLEIMVRSIQGAERDLPPEKWSSGNVTSPFRMARSGPERRSRAQESV